MDIKNLRPLPAINKGIVFGIGKSAKYDISLDCSSNIEQITDDLHFIIYVYITPKILLPDKSVSLETQHLFEAILGSQDIKLKTENDFWTMADIFQVSVSQARVFLMQESDKHSLKLDLLPMQPVSTYYQQIKDGHFSLWN